MRLPLLAVAVLVALTGFVHITGFALLLQSLRRAQAASPTRTWPIAWLLIRVK